MVWSRGWRCGVFDCYLDQWIVYNRLWGEKIVDGVE